MSRRDDEGPLHEDAEDALVMLREALEDHLRDNGSHVRRVAEYSRLLARLAGLDPEDAELLYHAAPLHDAGKIGIPDDVLHKPGPHTDAERAVMRTHVELGCRLLDRPGSVAAAAAIVAAQHHERWNGQGYPAGLRGEEIHVFGRIIALVDVFDALTSPRCYKTAWPLHRALDYLVEHSGTHFEPALVELFTQHFEQFLEIHDRLRDAPGPLH